MYSVRAQKPGATGRKYLCTHDVIIMAPFLANVKFMFAMSSAVRPSVCRLSVTFVRPTQAIEIFGNISTPFGTLAIC